MTIDKRFKGAPFGAQSHRFDVSGIHPKRKLPGTFFQPGGIDDRIGPGHYFNPDTDTRAAFSQKNLDKQTSGSGWERQLALERMATMPHLLYREQWEGKQEQKKKLGPGTYDLPDLNDPAMSLRKLGTRGMLVTLEKRFKDEVKEPGPAPGVYGRHGIPHSLKEEMDHKRSSASVKGLLENGGDGIRSLPVSGCRLGPGTYEIKTSVDMQADKLTSIRGPYDIFSLDRNKPIKTGHYATVVNSNCGPGQYEFGSFLDEQNTAPKRNHGRFLKMEQYPAIPHDRVYWCRPENCPRNPEEQVNPATYNPTLLPNKVDHHLVKTRPPFNSTSYRSDRRSQAFFTQNFNPVGAGRYDIQKYNDNQLVNAHRNLFLSKTEARQTCSEQAINKERLRAKDIPHKDRFIVDHVATEAEPLVDIRPTFKSRSLTIA